MPAVEFVVVYSDCGHILYELCTVYCIFFSLQKYNTTQHLHIHKFLITGAQILF